jgi:NADH dehydrogenase
VKVASQRLRICVLGGTGFVGTELVTALAGTGHQLRVATRRLDRGKHLSVLPTVELVVANVHDPRALAALLGGMDVVINLVGILNAHGRMSFGRVHVELVEKLLEAARIARVTRLLHMSALGADARAAPSQYLRTKGRAEELVRAASWLSATLFRPSVIFGDGDSLTNRFAGLLRLGGGFLPLARARARFAPVWVGDVAAAFTAALDTPASRGQVYELCGPQIVTLEDLVRLTAREAGLKCHILRVPDALGWAQAAVLGLLPGKPLSLDNFRSLRVDSLCRENGCRALGIEPEPMAAVLPTYLGAGPLASRLTQYRARH